MASVSVGENQLQRIIRDLRDAVSELGKEHRECGEPITDDSSNLHKFSYKLEYLLQFDQKEKTTFLGQRKDYWDYFCDCLAKIKGANDGIRFVKSIPELKTSLGKGRAFIRYSLVHQRLADTLQQCLINPKVTSDWYYARSPFLKSHLTADIINHLYELNQIQFDVAARGHDLDADWPTFARRTLGAISSSHLWRPPSRCSSINSLAQEFLPIPDLGHSLLGDLGELGEPSPCSIAEDLRIELDQSELRQQELLVRVQELGKESAELKGVVKDLEEQLLAAQRASPDPTPSSVPEAGHQETANHREAINCELQARLTAAENKNMELFSKLDGALSEKGQQTASYFDSAWKIQELLDKLKATEEERLEVRREAEDRARTAERLSQELRLREDVARRSEEQLADVKASAREEQHGALQRLEELQGAVGRIQGALTLKEKETGNLRAQLQNLQGSLESRERQAEELRKRLQEEREDVERRFFTSGSQNELLEGQVHELTEHLENCERELLIRSERVRHLEEQMEKMAVEKQSLCVAVPCGNEGHSCNHTKNLEDYKSQCTTLMELNGKLLQTVKRSEETTREMAESRAAMMDQLAFLRASEKHLKGRVDAAGMSVEDREWKLLEENLRLEETVQKSLVQSETCDARLKRLDRDNRDLLEAQLSLKKQLSATREELDAATSKASELDKYLAIAQRGQVELQDKLHGTEAELRDQTRECELLQRAASRAEEEQESSTSEVENEKGAAESTEKMQKLHDSHQTSSAKEANTRLVVTEAHLELNVREVRRLQEEVVQLRAQLLGGAEERMKAQAMQEVSEASRDDLRLLTEQLKAQVEELNRRHVDEILQSREREESLSRDRDCEARARMGLAAEVTASREELCDLKHRHEAACLENGESREALHRANTETAELGVHLCMLTAENEEARLRWEGLSAKLQELEDEAAQEAERLSTSMEQLQQENHELQQQCHDQQGLLQAMHVLQADLDKAQREARAVQDSNQEEIQALRFQLSSQGMSHRNQFNELDQELQEVRSQLAAKQEREVALESKVQQLETEAGQQMEEADAHMVQTDRLILQREEELDELKGNLYRSEEGRAVAEMACRELSESLRRATQDKQSLDLKAAAELDDLYRTKINLEERLIELIREKDVLWQKTDALEFEQKLRDEETERDVNYCLGCHSQFSWWLRKYNCRLCGRPFCYYCCSNTVSTHQGGGRERCCRDCYSQHSAVVERHPQEEAVTSPGAPFGHLLQQPGKSMFSYAGGGGGGAHPPDGPRPDDGAFDIITEEEVSGVYESDSLSFSTACSPGHGQQGAAPLNRSTSAGDTTSEEAEDQICAAGQDAEICLLKAGELTLSIPFTVDDIAAFGEDSRELFIKSSCYSTILISVASPGATVTWVFTSDPKSISFSVVYRESTEVPLEQAKVLIPLTRCNSHKETIQGELKVRNAGQYSLVFDNSFSRFISKKVLYRLSVEKPVVYDGSDCP